MARSPSAAGEPQLIDLLHLGRPAVIGAWRVGEVIVDPGPESCLERLLAVAADAPPRALALTHIHLDHAGAAGALVRRFPELEVWVHERGAPHLIDPSRLLASAERLYGEELRTLFGEVLPVPAERVRVLRGGEQLGELRCAYTPGHAVHHVAYLHEPSGTAFAGDVAGVRIGEGPVLAPTPPPDIDLVAWRGSLQLLRDWEPRRLALTHFGAHEDVGRHLSALEQALEDAERAAAELTEEQFAAVVRERVAQAAPGVAGAYAQAMPLDQSYSGLRRYLSRREQAGDAGGPKAA
jgi:glyoxylase-like metal-dependent hydrolase (beta-lactamase superfamily II)